MRDGRTGRLPANHRVVAAAAALMVAVVILLAGSALAATVTVTVVQGKSKSSQTRHVTLRRGEKLRVKFHGNWYDSGYSWRLTIKPSSAVLRRVGSRVVRSKRCCGFPETTYIAYRATRSGSTELRYTLTRSGRHAKSAGRLTIFVSVR